jgi:C1A family cysteine protease
MIMSNFSISYYPVVHDAGDDRDFLYENKGLELKQSVDLREWASKVRNQASLRSCSAEAVVGAYELLLKKKYPEEYIDLSPLFVYHNAAKLETKRPIADIGVYIRDAIRSAKIYGICAESVWPYNTLNFSVTPTEESYKDAEKRKIKNYFRIDKFQDILDALTNEIPVITALKTYTSFTRLGWDRSSKLLLPVLGADLYMGGHAVLLVGYDNDKQHLIAKNSFGDFWGDRGYFYIPFSYAEKEFMDSWIIEIQLAGHEEPDVVDVEIVD